LLSPRETGKIVGVHHPCCGRLSPGACYQDNARRRQRFDKPSPSVPASKQQDLTVIDFHRGGGIVCPVVSAGGLAAVVVWSVLVMPRNVMAPTRIATASRPNSHPMPVSALGGSTG